MTRASRTVCIGTRQKISLKARLDRRRHSQPSKGYRTKQNSHSPFYGYYFHMLNRQGSHAQGGAKAYVADGKMTGGFAFVANPAEYGNSGIMRFIINQDGICSKKTWRRTQPKQQLQ